MTNEKYLVTGDWHLDDRPENEYRWEAFDRVLEIKAQYPGLCTFILGDLPDRKDRYSSIFVNRLLNMLVSIAPVVVTRGNHDTTLRAPHFLDFVTPDTMRAPVRYISTPTIFNDDLLLLPFTPNPVEDWKTIDFSRYRCLFMHVTYPEALAENGQKMDGTALPNIHRITKIYSGDVHTPQRFDNFVHVGAPHPIKFGDRYPCRMLVLDENFDIANEINLSPLRRLMIDIRSVEDLARIKTKPGDQIKIRYACSPNQIEGLAAVEHAINDWLKTHELVAAGTEVIVQSHYQRDVDINQTPEYILRQFAQHEGLTDDLLEIGLELLSSAS